jgi:Tfp pilus assembly protein PilF
MAGAQTLAEPDADPATAAPPSAVAAEEDAPAPAVAVVKTVVQPTSATSWPFSGGTAATARPLLPLGASAPAPPAPQYQAAPQHQAAVPSIAPVQGVSVTALAVPSGGTPIEVPVLIEMDGPAMLAGVTGPRLEFEIYAYAVDAEGGSADYLSKGLSLDLVDGRAEIEAAGVRFYGLLRLEPGEYELRVLVKNASSGLSAQLQRALSVPAPDAAALSAGMPLVGSGAERGWLFVRQQVEAGTAVAPYHFTPDGGDSFVPAGLPALVPGQPVPVRVLVHGLGEAPPRLNLEVLNERGDVVLGQELVVEERLPAAGASRWLTTSLRLEGLAFGDYQFQLRVFDDMGRRTVTPRAPLRIAAPGSLGPRWQIAEEVETPEERLNRGERRQRIASRYQLALAMLADGREAEAAAAVARLEEAEAEGNRDLLLQDLASAETEVARRIGQSNPEALLPVALLHEAVYRSFRDGDNRLLARHAREAVRQLAELYIELGGSPTSLAASIFTSLGSSLQQAGMTSSANSLFERALELKTDHLGALLSLAVYYEKTGKYDRAATYLERLLKSHPDHAQAALRLGVNLRRLEKVKDAARWLDRAAGSNEPWVRSLALQEQILIDIDEKRWSAAEKRARAAILALPAEQRFYLLLAMGLDRQGRTREARLVLADLSPSLEQNAGSARWAYNRWPVDLLQDERTLLIATASARRPMLAQAISALGAVEREAK